MTDVDETNAQAVANDDSKTDVKKGPEEVSKVSVSGGVKLFRLLLLVATGVFLYTANEGQDNMFEDFAEIADKAKSKVVSIFKPSPVGVASQIVQRGLKSPDSFKLREGDLIWTGRAKSGDPAYIVLLNYTAQNGFGGTVRGCH